MIVAIGQLRLGVAGQAVHLIRPQSRFFLCQSAPFMDDDRIKLADVFHAIFHATRPFGRGHDIEAMLSLQVFDGFGSC